MYYIGVDLGTSSVKLLLMDKQGTVVKTVSKEYPISFPKPGWSEQNPYDWYVLLVVCFCVLFVFFLFVVVCGNPGTDSGHIERRSGRYQFWRTDARTGNFR